MDELRYFTQGRYLQIKFLLYRPFLYYALHYTATTNRGDLALPGFVQKSLDSCLTVNSGLAMTHRHHGTWYGLRNAITAGFMLVAARLGGLVTTADTLQVGQVHENAYGHAILACLQRLRYWEAESTGDIRRASEMLQELCATV